MIQIIVCEKMKKGLGWYLAQPDYFISMLLSKWSIDSDKADMDAKQAKVESSSKAKKY